MNEPATLVALLLDRAESAGSAGYEFLVDGEELTERLTYAELANDALLIAREVSALAPPGSRVLLLYPPGLEFVRALFGALVAGVVAVPMAPPVGDVSAWVAAFDRIVADAGPVAILTTVELRALKTEFDVDLADDGRPWIATDGFRSKSGSTIGVPRRIRSEDIALIQYTSGSTSAPKGVVLSHSNLLANQAAMRDSFQCDAHSRFVSWLPMFHDMGLIGCVMQPLYAGTDCWFMSPLDFLQKPVRWLEAITRYEAKVSGGPNFAYDLCVRRIGEHERAHLDLSSWRVAFNGAEPIRPATIDAFAEAFASAGFRRRAFAPCYGLAEASLLVTGVPVSSEPTVLIADRAALENGSFVGGAADQPHCQVVSVGPSALHTEVVVVDEAGARCGDGQVGEVWVAGPGIAAGYWRQPAVSEQVFHAFLTDGSGPYLRTGDRGFLLGGELFITGRIKEMLVVRGRNIFPQDIELVAQRDDPRLRPGCGAAFSVDTSDGELPVIVQELRDGVEDADEVPAAIRARVVAGLGIPIAAIALVPARTLPKTTSGKLRRLATRDAFLSDALPIVTRWDAVVADEVVR